MPPSARCQLKMPSPRIEFHAFRFAIDAAVERVKRFEDFHRRTSGLFGFHPLIAQELPTFQARCPSRIVRELRNPRFCTILGFLQSFLDGDGIRRIVPTVFQPCGNFLGRFGRASQPRTLHLQNVIRAALFRTLAVLRSLFSRELALRARLVEWKDAREDRAARDSTAARESAVSQDCDAGSVLPDSGTRA